MENGKPKIYFIKKVNLKWIGLKSMDGDLKILSLCLMEEQIKLD
jgi:hypothetical protein